MPELTPLPDGSVQVTDETGSTYIMPEDSAARLYPEQMQQHYAPIDFPQMDGPQAGQYDPSMGPPTIANQLAQAQPQEDPGMVMDPMVIGGEEPEMVMEPMQLEDQPGTAPAPPWRQSQSRSVSRSRSWTGPYQEARHVGAPLPPDPSEHMDAAKLSYLDRMESLNQQREATQRHVGAMEEQYGSLAAQREETARRSQEMHEAGMQGVAQAEARLNERVQNMQRMDMNKVWKETPLGARMVGVFSAGIAGWLNPTGQNSVIQQMSDLMDKSAREQAENMAQERFQIGMQQSALDRLERRGEASRRVYLENRAVLESSLLSQIQMEEKKYSSEITLARFGEMKAAAGDMLRNTLKEYTDTAYAQAADRWHKQALIAESVANRKAAAARQRSAQRHAEKMAAAKRAGGGILPPEFQHGDPLFVDDKGRTIYAKKGLKRSDKQVAEFDTAVTLGRQLADDAKELAKAVHKYKRAIKFAEPEDVAVIEAKVNDLIDTMRPKVGANLPEGEAKKVYAQFGSPMSVLKKAEVTERLINEQIKRQGKIVDQRLGQWGSTIGEPVLDQSGRPILSPLGDEWLERQIKYQRGVEGLRDLFGPEFDALNLNDEMRATAEKSLKEMVGIQNMLDELPEDAEAARANAESRMVDIAAGLMDYARNQGLTEKQNEGLYEQIDKVTAGIDPTRFKVAAMEKQFFRGYRGEPGSTVGEEFRSAAEEEESGQRLAPILREERSKYGMLGAAARAANGESPLTLEEYKAAEKHLGDKWGTEVLSGPAALGSGSLGKLGEWID